MKRKNKNPQIVFLLNTAQKSIKKEREKKQKTNNPGAIRESDCRHVKREKGGVSWPAGMIIYTFKNNFF